MNHMLTYLLAFRLIILKHLDSLAQAVLGISASAEVEIVPNP